MELLSAGINPIQFPGLRVAVSSDESKMINFDKKPKVIISASGMCEAGRILSLIHISSGRQLCVL